MTNRILRLDARDHSVVPAEAEVRVTVVPEFLGPGTEVRGRLMGPRCPFASTVEIAYHLRPLPVREGQGELAVRAIIPEACLWEPETPFLYAGPVELWQDGQRCEAVGLQHGLRQVTLNDRGLHVNGRLRPLRGRFVDRLDDAEALRLREAGFNLLLAPVREGSPAVWETASRIGFFVLGRLHGGEPGDLLERLARHPSCLGWLLAGDAPAPAEVPAGTLLGVENAAHPAFGQARFLATDTPSAGGGLPVLLTRVPAEQGGRRVPCPPGAFGAVEV